MHKSSKRSIEESLALVPSNAVVMFFISVVVDRASFEKTSEMANVKSFDCQLLESKSTTLLQMSVKFYAVLSLSLCIVLISGHLLDQSLKKSSNFFSEAIKDAQLTVLQCRILTAQTMMPTGVLLFLN